MTRRKAPGAEALDVIGEAEAARAALSPIRRRLLERLGEPASAAGLGKALGLPRQQVRHHLKVLAEAGLIVEAGGRRRRGFVETLYVARAGARMIDPMLLAGPAAPAAVEAQDRHAAEHLVRAAARMVHEVGRMQEAAAREGSRLLTFTLEADLGFARPAEIEAFTERLARAVAELARDYPAEGGRRRYRLTAAGHPAVGGRSEDKPLN